MGKILETKISRFDGGILEDLRENISNGYAITKHFDVSKPKTLKPYRSSEANETKTMFVSKFLQVNSKLYGYGVISGELIDGKVQIVEKTGDMATGAWTTSSSAQMTAGARNRRAFFHYKGYVYGWKSSTHLWRWGDITGTPSFTDAYQAVAYTNVAQPVLHPADDIAYFFYDNKVASLNNTTWNAGNPVLTLPSNLIIVDAEPVGNFLAIACKPITAEKTNNSIVFLWDRDSSLTTISQKIDWGVGNLKWIAYLDGNLIGISEFYVDDATGGAEGELHIRIASGDKARLIRRIRLTATESQAENSNKIVTNDKLYFPAEYEINNEEHEGIWAIDSQGRMTLEVVEEDATNVIDGIFKMGIYWFLSHSADGSVNRTDDATSYTFTSSYTSRIFNTVDSATTKKLLGITVMTEELPSATAQVVLKYLTDEDIAAQDWSGTATTIFTHTGADSISHSAVNVESTGVTLPEYKEIQFRIESTKGAIITALKFKEEALDKDLY